MLKIETLFNGDIAYAFGWTMLHSLWQGTLIALALAVTLHLHRHHSAAFRYTISLLALFTCLVTSIITFSIYHHAINEANLTAGSFGDQFTLLYSGAIQEDVYRFINAHLDYLLAAWLVGFGIHLFRYVRDFYQSLRLKNGALPNVPDHWQAIISQRAQQLGIGRTVELKNSTRVSSVCVLGHLKPVILLPIGLLTALSPEQVEAVLLHELAHIKRHDYLANTLQSWIRLFYFFNPAVLWISTRIDIEREHACDDIAVEACGSARVYATGLANISELEMRLNTVLAANNNRYRILPRVTRLFANSAGVSRGLEQLITVVFAGVAIVAVNVSAGEISNLANSHFHGSGQSSASGTSAAAQLEAFQVVAPAAPEAKVAVAEPPAAPAVAEQVPTIEKPSAINRPSAPPRAPEAAFQEASPALDYAMRLASAKAPRTPAAAVAPASDVHSSLNRELQFASVAGLVTASDTASSQLPEPTDSLQRMSTPDFDEFYISEQARLPVSRKLYIESVDASFANVWLERFGAQTSTNYRNTTLREFKRGFTKELVKHMKASGWRLVNQPEDDVIRLRASLVDIYIQAPESPGIKQTLVRIAGQAGTVLEYQTPEGQTFMKIVDYRQTTDAIGSPFVANRATNYHYFRMLMEEWADASLPYLENIVKLAEQSHKNG